MPTNRRHIGPRSLTALTLAQESYLKCGRYYFDIAGEEDHFADDDEVDAAWQQNREKVFAEWNRPGKRPPLMWELDVGLECIRWPDQWAWPDPYENEADLVRAMVLAGELESCRFDGANRITDEVEQIEAAWRHMLYVEVQHAHGWPQIDPAESARDQGVPAWFVDRHLVAVKTKVAAERAAFRRSIARYIR